MSDGSWKFQSIRVIRMPGFTRRGFLLANLSPGLNIVFGPNGAGKTTTANVIRSLLWPDTAPETAILEATATIRGQRWRCSVELGQARYHQDDQPAQEPGLPSSVGNSAYRLSLHELLQKEQGNQEFAQIILRESIGGYDIPAALDELGFTPKPSTPRSLIQAAATAKDKVAAAQRAQQDLAGRQDELQQLQQEKRRCQAIQLEIANLEKALSYTRAQQNVAAAAAKVATFPQELAKLTGNEQERLDEWTESREKLSSEKEQKEREKELSARQKAEANLPEAGLPAGFITGLAGKLDRLKELARKVTEKKGIMEQALAETAKPRQYLGEAVRGEKLDTLTPELLSRIAEVARKAEGLRERRQALEEYRQWLGVREDRHDPGKLHEAISLASRWLRSQASATGSRLKPLVLGSSLFTMVAALFLAFSIHWSFCLFCAVGMVLLIVTLTTGRKDDGASYLQQEYVKLEVEQPESWSPPAVEKLVENLVEAYNAAKLNEQRAQAWAGRAAELEKLKQQETLLAEEARRIAATLGLPANIHEAELYVFAANLVNWQAAHQKAQGAAAEYQSLRAEYLALLDDFNTALQPFSYAPAQDDAEASAFLEDIKERDRRFTAAAEKLSLASRELEQRIVPGIKQLEGKIAGFYSRLGLENGDATTLAEWLRQLAAYREAVEEQGAAERELKKAQAALGESKVLQNKSLEEIEGELLEKQNQAGRLEDVIKKISEIDTLVREAKKGHELEQALSAESRKRAELEDRLEDNCLKKAGFLLAEFVRKQHQDAHSPPLFRRARENLLRFTQGLYQLEFDDREAPSFTARDTVSNEIKTLDTLSTGTKLQLLIAVRLAFIEVNEKDIQLPLVLDEILANTDDVKMRAIMEAVLDICSRGRQVFYLTAKRDELGKWLGILRGRPKVAFRDIDLLHARGLKPREDITAAQLIAVPESEVPEPEGLDHEQYGKLLGVPPLDLFTRSSAAVHLWYLADDVDLLYRLLKRSVVYWGQLKALCNQPGADPLSGDRPAYTRIEASARALEMGLKLAQIGRARAVTRAILTEANLSRKKRQQVIELAQELGGDAQQLMEKLEAKAVAGIGPGTCRKIRAHLEASGCLPANPPLSREEIISRVTEKNRRSLERGTITAERIRQLLARAGL